MEDNSMNGEDNKKKNEKKDEDCNDSQSGKKMKLNDGSSQNNTETESKESLDTFDSGISVEIVNSSSEDPSTSQVQEESANIVIAAGASLNSVRRLLCTLRRPRRIYRNRNNHDESDSSSSSVLDSDDLSQNTGAPLQSANDNDEDDRESPNLESILNRDDSSSSSSFEMNTLLSSSESGSSSSDSVFMSHGSMYSRARLLGFNFPSEPDNLTPEVDTPTVLTKAQPQHNWCAVKEVINRELGLTGYNFGKALRYDIVFEKRFYGSLHAVYRLKKYQRLYKHKGCVNSINFHPEGHILASGSDDTHVIIWDWARNVPLQNMRTGHRSNVFQSKFLYLNASSQLNIVTCAKDGQVRLLTTPSSGGTPTRRKLYSHTRAAHKLHVTPAEPHVIISAGEDGKVLQTDIRTNTHQQLISVRNSSDLSIPLYSVHGHPLDCRRMIVAGRDKFIRTYDTRQSSQPCDMYCPSFFIGVPNSKGPKMAKMYLTCAVYNYNGTEILGSYNDEDVYLFDTEADKYEIESSKVGYTHRYSGHRNCATFKGVGFFGPESEYVMSGSDCSYIYIWDKHTEAIVQWLQADTDGVVNCIEGHPKHPVLASSGLDYDVKVWLPILEQDPVLEGLEPTVKVNCNPHYHNVMFNTSLAEYAGEAEDEASIHFNANECVLS